MAVPDLGVFLPSMSDPTEAPGDIAAAARHAEDLGLESVWVVDQLIAGTGSPLLDSAIALAAAAAVTTRVQLGFGVLILPLRPVAWVAKQVASLQHISGDRVILGIGAGGDRHDGSWIAAGVPRQERGRRTDDALRVLPPLIAGKQVRLDDSSSSAIELAPGATVPPILVGGMSEAAMRRAVEHGDGWFLLPVPPNAVADARARIADVAATDGRAMPSITAGMLTAIDGDPHIPGHDALVHRLTDPDGMYGMPEDAVSTMLVRGGPERVATRIAELGDQGADRVVVSVAAGDWYRQVELLAKARSLAA